MLSCSIMAHPDRAAKVDELQAALGRPMPVAWDDEGDPQADPERVWRTARKAWELHNPNAQWHLLLQDDAIVAPDLLEATARGLDFVGPRAIVSLYIGTGRPVPWMWQKLGEKASEAAASWIVGPRVMWGVALAVRTESIPDMLTYADLQYGVPDDMRVGRWARRQKWQAWFPWPSLVNHPDDESLIGHGPGRQALKFVGGSALEWNPAGAVIS